jgi:hypothetical protein
MLAEVCCPVGARHVAIKRVSHMIMIKHNKNKNGMERINSSSFY